VAVWQAAIRWQGGKHAGHAQRRIGAARPSAHCKPCQRLALERELHVCKWIRRGRREKRGVSRGVSRAGGGAVRALECGRHLARAV
jgi:hypothetical protein